MATLSQGATVQINDGASGAYADLADIVSITFPGAVCTEVETSNLDTTTYKTFTAGLKDPGELSVSQQFSPTEYERLTALIGTSKSFKVIDSSVGTTAAFSGYIKSCQYSAPGVDQLETVETVIRISGTITTT